MRRLTLPLPGLSNRSGKAADARAERKRRARRKALLRFGARAGIPAAVIAAIVGSGVWAWQTGWLARQGQQFAHAAVGAAANAGLTLDQVIVTGRERTQPDSILAALGIRQGGPILGFDPAQAKRRLENLPWVKAATVERRLPGTVRIALTERTPLALWQLDGRLSVIDHEGHRIDRTAPEAHTNLPLVVGPGAPEHAEKLLALLASEPEMNARVQAAVRVRDRRWNIVLRNGVEVQLPAQTPARAWSRLAAVERKHGVLQRDVRMIDLRLPDRMVVRMSPGSKPMSEPPGMGEST
ncbi:cell division protein FtsQ/DivIB [Rhodovibrio salinarum]|nr:FtsQ-type POTRA domain-containing protein [Rhodovibrio salinarum]